MALLRSETRICNQKHALGYRLVCVLSMMYYVLGLARRNGARLYVIHVVKAGFRRPFRAIRER